jgi:hypothetical protein
MKIISVRINPVMTGCYVSVQFDSFNFTMPYDQYEQVCKKLNINPLPEVKRNVALKDEFYVINDSFFMPSYWRTVANNGDTKNMPLSALKINLADGIAVFTQWEAFTRASEELQAPEFYPFDKPVLAASDENSCLPKCSVM